MLTRINHWIDDRLKNRDRSFMEATARNAAATALHRYTCVRTIETWRQILDEAEQDGNKYVAMADLIERSGFERTM